MVVIKKWLQKRRENKHLIANGWYNLYTFWYHKSNPSQPYFRFEALDHFPDLKRNF